MKIHEYQGKEILKKYGVPVPRGIPAFSVDDALKAEQIPVQGFMLLCDPGPFPGEVCLKLGAAHNGSQGGWEACYPCPERLAPLMISDVWRAHDSCLE